MLSIVIVELLVNIIFRLLSWSSNAFMISEGVCGGRGLSSEEMFRISY